MKYKIVYVLIAIMILSSTPILAQAMNPNSNCVTKQDLASLRQDFRQQQLVLIEEVQKNDDVNMVIFDENMNTYFKNLTWKNLLMVVGALLVTLPAYSLIHFWIKRRYDYDEVGKRNKEKDFRYEKLFINNPTSEAIKEVYNKSHIPESEIEQQLRPTPTDELEKMRKYRDMLIEKQKIENEIAMMTRQPINNEQQRPITLRPKMKINWGIFGIVMLIVFVISVRVFSYYT